MTTATIRKLKKEIKQELIKEFILPILETSKDPEGEYRNEFINSVLKAAQERPKYRYDSKTFLKLIS